MRFAPLLLLAACTGYRPADSTEGDADADTDADTDTDTVEPAIVVNDYFRLAKSRPKNVIVLSWDTFRRDHSNAMGYTAREVTPTLDRVMTEGVGFFDHSSCSSWTFPSFTCVLTGRDQLDNHFWPYAVGADLPEAPAGFPLVSSIFHDLGYHTGIYSASGFLGASAGMFQGYDDGFGEFDQDGPETKADEILDDGIEYLDDRLREPETPFYLHLHFIDPHMPWIPPEEYLGWEEELEPVDADFTTEDGTVAVWSSFPSYSAAEQQLLIDHMVARYDGEIRFADDQTQRLLDYLDTNGFWENTILVFVSDHGEEFYEHENFNHGYNQFEQVTRTVAAFYQPGNLLPAEVDEQTWHPDLMPTLFAILGIDPSASPTWGGFTGHVVGSDDPHPYIVSNTYRIDRTHQAIQDDHTKLMLRWDESDLLGGPKYFYDLDSDPVEADNLYDGGTPDGVDAWWDKLCPAIEYLDDNEPAASAVSLDGECN
jgi:arylsulfatase A-like enzyme